MLALSLMAYVWHLSDRDRYGIRRRVTRWWSGAVRQRQLGYAAGISLALESSAFSILGLFAGMVGPLDLGAYTILLNLVALSFMTAVGLATATGVRVGVAYGRRDRREIMVAGWTGLGVTTVILAVFAVLFALLPRNIGGLFHGRPRNARPDRAARRFQRADPDRGRRAGGHGERAARQADAWVPTVLHFSPTTEL